MYVLYRIYVLQNNDGMNDIIISVAACGGFISLSHAMVNP